MDSRFKNLCLQIYKPMLTICQHQVYFLVVVNQNQIMKILAKKLVPRHQNDGHQAVFSPQVEGIIEAAEKYSGKSARLNSARPPGASRVYNTRGVGGGIRNSNAIHSDLLFIMGTPELG